MTLYSSDSDGKRNIRSCGVNPRVSSLRAACETWRVPQCALEARKSRVFPPETICLNLAPSRYSTELLTDLIAYRYLVNILTANWPTTARRVLHLEGDCRSTPIPARKAHFSVPIA
jgi:hypothetical protein